MEKQWKQWDTLFSWAPKSLQMVTAAMKLKDACFLEEKLWSNRDSILRSRDITLPTKVRIVKAIVFPVVVYGCESWTIKKAEHQRIDAFELRCWRRLLRVSWTARRSNQSILKAAAAAKSLQLCLTLCNSIDGSPPGSPIPGILQARTLQCVTISWVETPVLGVFWKDWC